MEYDILLKATSGKKIYVDLQEEEGFYLYPGEIRKCGLKDGSILTTDQIFAIWKEYALPRAKKRALGLLSKKDMTEKELQDKLKSSLNDSRSIAAAMDFVLNHGYVDDASYAKDYLSSHKKRKSYRQIREELTRRGISRTILENLFEEEGSQDKEMIRPLVIKYCRKFPKLDSLAIQKICMHFGRKGYRLDEIRQILKEMKEEA